MQFREIIYLSGQRKLLEIRFTFTATQERDTGIAEVYELGTILCFRNKPINIFKANNRERVIAKFTLVANHDRELFVFGPVGHLGMLPLSFQGNGIGRYCVSKLIRELVPKFNDYAVKSGKLSLVDADSESTKNNRNHFYKSLGFVLDLDETSRYGKFTCSEPKQLTRKWNKKKVRRISPTYFAIVISNLSKVKNKLIAVQDENEQLKVKMESFEKWVARGVLTIPFLIAIYLFANVL